MTGYRIKLPKGKTIKNGKVVTKPVALSRPAQYAKAKKRTYRKAST